MTGWTDAARRASAEARRRKARGDASPIKRPNADRNMTEDDIRRTNIMRGRPNPPRKPPHRASRQGGQHFGGKTTGGAFGRGEPPQPKYPNRGRT